MSDEVKKEAGPIYGRLILSESLPIGGGMKQALPSREDLVRAYNTPFIGNLRVVGGYEILCQAYIRLHRACLAAASESEPGSKAHEILLKALEGGGS